MACLIFIKLQPSYFKKITIHKGNPKTIYNDYKSFDQEKINEELNIMIKRKSSGF